LRITDSELRIADCGLRITMYDLRRSKVHSLPSNVYFYKMPRILAIDYGTKRCGIAVTDPSKIIATGLTTVHSKDIIEWLTKYMEKEAVELILIGEPKNLKGEKTDASIHADAFVKNLKKSFPEMKTARIDERFTSKMASRTLLDSGLKKKDRQNKELVDEISATIMLQDFLAAM
jgi:putative holliday junction resolvase